MSENTINQTLKMYELTKITDYGDIATYGVIQTPALVINETVVFSGRIPKHEQIIAWACERETA